MASLPRFVYFAGEPLGVPILEALIAANTVPALVVTNPDRPAGRGLTLTPPPVKVLAEKNSIPVWQPDSFKDEMSTREKLSAYELFVVVAYSKILPKWLIELPKYKTINVHPSLLPKLRGASPIRTAILQDAKSALGVSVMLMDEKMDHGPILAQEAYLIDESEWPMSGTKLDAVLATLGGEVLIKTLPAYIAGSLTLMPQADEEATYTKRLIKTDGELILNPHMLPQGEEARETLRKIRAFTGYPGTYFFHNKQRIKIVDANIENDTLVIIEVTPEGKHPQPFAQWLAHQR